MYKQYIYLADIAFDFSYNPLYPPFKSTTTSINKWLDNIIPCCNNIITTDIYNYLNKLDISKHNIKTILHVFHKALLYRDSITHQICGIVLWISTKTSINIIYSHADNEEIYNIMISDMEIYTASLFITVINILWNTGSHFNIINESCNIENTILYKLCYNNYLIKEQSFSKDLPPNNKYYNINQYRYIHKELGGDK